MLRWRFCALLAFAASLSAQPGAPSVFAQVGAVRLGGDDGSFGTAASLGGGVAVPIHRRWLAELDVQTAKVKRIRSTDSFYITRRTLALGNILYRWGGERVQIFAGGGVGGQFVDSTTRDDGFEDHHVARAPWREIRPRVFEFTHRETRPIFFAPKAGFVVNLRGRLGVRTDVYAASWHIGVRVGVAYRFR